MGHQNPALDRFTWKINNFTKLGASWCLSDIFTVDGCEWQIEMHPKGCGGKFLSLCLRPAKSLPIGWTREVSFSLSLIDQKGGAHTTKRAWRTKFCQEVPFSGFSMFMSLNELQDPKKGYLMNDTVIIEAEVLLVAATPPINYSNVTVSPVGPLPDTNQMTEFESYAAGLEDFLANSATRVGPCSDRETPSSEEVEKAKKSLQECLSDFFQLSMKDRLLKALLTLRSSENGLSPEQESSIRTFWANFDNFVSDFVFYEKEELEFKWHKLGAKQTFGAVKRSHETHTQYRELLDGLNKEEEELERKLQAASSKKQKLISDWKDLMAVTEEAKSQYISEVKQLAEAEERRRNGEERRARLTGAWLKLKKQFT